MLMKAIKKLSIVLISIFYFILFLDITGDLLFKRIPNSGIVSFLHDRLNFGVEFYVFYALVSFSVVLCIENALLRKKVKNLEETANNRK